MDSNRPAAPMDFDWVTARHRCSLDSIFQVLSEIVDSNVRAANGLRKAEATFERKVLNGKLMVLRQRDLSGIPETSSVVFELSLSAITVKRLSQGGAERQLFVATPSFTEEGECVLEIEGKILCLWQVSRRALEDLFFGS